MSTLVIIPYVIVLVISVFATACLVYDRGAYRKEIDRLLRAVRLSEAEIRALRGYIDNKEKGRKLYIFESGDDRIEDVISWRVVDPYLRLTRKDGSLYVLRAPSRYKFITQEQSEEEPA